MGKPEPPGKTAMVPNTSKALLKIAIFLILTQERITET
jgi:hypothetical protein